MLIIPDQVNASSERPILPKIQDTLVPQNTVQNTTSTTALSILFDHPIKNPVHSERSEENSDEILTFCKKLEVENCDLQHKVQDLLKKLAAQNQALQNVKRKYSRRESVIKKLRSDLSSLRKEKRKLRHREYMRKVKQKKVAEKRRERRAWICKQIELGHMDKSSMSLVYSRKSLPFEIQDEVPQNSVNIQTIVKAVDEIYASTTNTSETENISINQ